MAGINRVTIIGNLGQEPELKFMPNGNAVANFTVATSEKWKDKQTGEDKETTEWHRVVIYQRLAEIAGEYLKKGSKVYLEGKLRTRKWQNQQGADQYTTEIIVNEMQMLDGKPQNSGQQQSSYNQPNQAPQQSSNRPQQGGYQQPQQQRQPHQQGGYQNQPVKQ